MKKITGVCFRATALASVLVMLPIASHQSAFAANGFFDLFRKKQPLSIEQAAPAVSKNVNNDKSTFKVSPSKMMTIAAPKAFDYKPEKLVEFDFSQVDFRHTASTSGAPLVLENKNVMRLPLLPPYNVVVAISTTVQPAPVTSDERISSEVTFFSSVHVMLEKNIGDTLLNYYGHNPHFVWWKNNHLTNHAEQLIAYLKKANEDGLDPADYYVELPNEALSAEEQGKAWAKFDVLLSAKLLRYVQDASEGRIIANRLSPFHDLPRESFDLNDSLVKLIASEQPVSLLSSHLPQSNWYLTLKLALADLRQNNDVQVATISSDTIMRPGQSNVELPKFVSLLLKKAPQTYLDKYNTILKAHLNDPLYSPELKPAIQEFQKNSGKSSDGVIGPSTIALLQDDGVEEKKQKIIDSLERLRWLPHQFGERYVFINQPAFRAQYFDNGQEKLNMKIVVGSARNQTYFFYDKIRLVTFNPSWGVPRSIMMNEMMPKIARDPNYLSRNGYELYNSAGKQVAPGSVDWQQVASSGRGVGVRQSPGKNNALGELKIMFPNKHDIYMHDTPNKAPFSRDMRALSHGCVRLENPRAMAAAVMGKDVNDLKPYFGKNERSISLPEQVPVYLVYFTAWPNIKTGKMDYFNDVYERDQGLKNAMEKTDLSRKANI